MEANRYSASLVLLCLAFFGCHSNEQRPNIVVILADDMGYSDLGCTGSEIETPNLDGLAEQGILFTNCYNTSRCCPTRASILTGMYQHQAGYGHMDSDLGYPAYQGRFREHVVTVAQLLQEVDYRTIMLGKWHLGHEDAYTPRARGFDKMYGIPKGGGVYFYPCVGRDRQVYLNEELMTPDSTWYSTDAFTDYAIEFAREAKADKKSFFMYLAYIAPHFPLQAPTGDIDKYRGKYSKGYKFYRQQRFAKQKQLGILSPSTVLSPPDYDDWDSREDQETEDLKMAVYAAQVDRMDQNIGRLISALRKSGVFDNTVTLFLSDNGATDAHLDAFPDAELGSRNSWASYGKSWANVSNTPYRKYKAQTHEGGVITPMIMHWPEGIKAPGRTLHQPIHIIDIVPTILSLTGTQYPKKYAGKEMMPLVGADFMPLVLGSTPTAVRTMFFEHAGNQAARVGNWKIVKTHMHEWELYDLERDPTELQNVIHLEQKKMDSLKMLFNQWATLCGVQPWPIEKNEENQ